MHRVTHLILISLLFLGCAKNTSRYSSTHLSRLPEAPDYSDCDYWAALPEEIDLADKTPDRLMENQNKASADVFFVHPTIYTGKQHEAYPWNADLKDEELNTKVDESTILNQATVFNESARVYTPRYRQAHIKVFRIDDQAVKNQALDYAYEDVKAAFEYYLKYKRNGRPFIIAGHSQGTIHAGRLIQDYIEKDDQLRADFIAAYLVGIALKPDLFKSIPPCEGPTETGCWMSWNTFAYDYHPKKYEEVYRGTVTTNPLSWSATKQFVPRNENPGSILWNFEKIRPQVCDALVTDGLLWIHKPQFPGSFLFNWKSYHPADYNLFYMSIRENVADRVNSFLSERSAAN